MRCWQCFAKLGSKTRDPTPDSLRLDSAEECASCNQTLDVMPVAQKSVPPTPAPALAPAQAHDYENQHVHEVYDRIAPHFAATRHTPWPKVNDFLKSLPQHAVLADLGCGNGKYLRAAEDLPLVAMGTDRCAPLVQLAQKVAPTSEMTVAEILHLPYRDNFFDAALNIAVVHHLSTAERRIRALKETTRILRPGGLALIYVWALERPNSSKSDASSVITRRFDTQDVFVPWHMRTRKEGAQSEKILGDWHHVHHRFYHVYKQGELEDELSNVEGINVRHSYYDHQNWCAIIEKL